MDADQLTRLASRLGVDLKVALQDGALEAEDFVGLLDACCETHGDDPRALRQDCAAGDWRAVRERAHSLKGSTGAIGAQDLHRLAAEVDTGIRTAGAVDPDLIERLAGALDAFLRAARDPSA